jgi:hypothetical protein
MKKKEFADWLTSVRSCRDKAHCKLCIKNFDIGNMGVSAIVSHMQSAKHKHLWQERQQLASTQNSLNFFATASATGRPTAGPSSRSEEATVAMTSTSPALSDTATSVSATLQIAVPTTGTRTPALTSFLNKDDVTKAEIMWTLKTVMSNYSYNSATGLNELLQAMFPDSEIAKKFQLSSTKMAYIIRFGLAPYFHSELLSQVKNCDHFVLAFDESLNKVTQHGQMDIHIRFFDNLCGKVNTRYLGSQFLGHATANDLVDKFVAAMKDLNCRKLIQISMDGPSVNWSFIEKLKKNLERDPGDPFLLELGSCSLHIVHGAFQTGGKASGFDISHLLTSLYYVFNDSPARRDDHTKLTSSKTFPLKFCAHHWLENGPVAERAIQIWEHVKKYVTDVKKKPDSHSFKTVKDTVADPLTIAKLSFFVSVISHLERFLTMFQGDRPLVPFLCDEVHAILKSLMTRFIKTSILKEADTVLKLCKIDCEDTKNHKEYKHVDVGFAANAALQSAPKTVSDLQKMSFHVGCCKFLAAMTTKLLQRNPLQYSLVRNLSCLSPRNLAASPEKSTTNFKKVLEILLAKKHFTADQCDVAGRQFAQFCEAIVQKKSEEFVSFQETKQKVKEAARLDEFYAKFVRGSEEYSVLWDIFKFCLVLSHGQATVESGFSTNKQMLVENQAEETLVGQRHVHDAVLHAGTIQITTIPKMSLMHYHPFRFLQSLHVLDFHRPSFTSITSKACK